MSNSRPSLYLDAEGYFLPTPRYPSAPISTQYPYRPPVDKPLPANHIDRTVPALSMSVIVPRDDVPRVSAREWPQNSLPGTPAPEGFVARFASEHTQGSRTSNSTATLSSGWTSHSSSPREPTGAYLEEMIFQIRGPETFGLRGRARYPCVSWLGVAVKEPTARPSSAPPSLGR